MDSTSQDSIPHSDVMAEIITEIRGGGAAATNNDTDDATTNHTYVMALNSLMNTPERVHDAQMDRSDVMLPSDSVNREGSVQSSQEERSDSLTSDSNNALDDNRDRGGTPKDSTTPKETPPFHIGGPNTRLPFFVESFLGWSLCFSCLAVPIYHYAKSIFLSTNWYCKVRHGLCRWILSNKIIGGYLLGNKMKQQLLEVGHDASKENHWIPLTTCTREELSRNSPWESYLLLVRLLEKEYPETLVPLLAAENNADKLDGVSDTVTTSLNSADEVSSSNDQCYTALTQKADVALVKILRHDDVCRRLASLAMRPHEVNIETNVTTTTKTVSVISPTTMNSASESHTITVPAITTTKSSIRRTTSTLLKQLPHNHLLQRLSYLWDRLLALPSLEEAKTFYRIPTTDPPVAQKSYLDNDARHAYKISLILPAFGEEGSHLKIKLTRALEMACSPENVEVIIVDAGGCKDLEIILEEQPKAEEKHWGRICIVAFKSGGGRGPCLNYGASTATGCILTFCHADTSLPLRWDDRIIKTLEHGNKDDYEIKRSCTARVNSCSFNFGIDTSPKGLCMPFTSSLNNYFPPGIRAVVTTANMRSYMYSLPYGDSTLSLHACVFHFLGGYPDQCLMEDYELVTLMRLRGALIGGEKLAMIRGQPALCSPRRWQKFGVLYVTYMNSKFVNLYATSICSGDLFRMYYGKEPPKRRTMLSPWEIELENRLNGKVSV